uniref:Doublecortin domain-containing protein n=1 Tax=Parastrongyloides trichosuri TaxID=131310 RepID=A0A0N4Z986_PARTI
MVPIAKNMQNVTPTRVGFPKISLDTSCMRKKSQTRIINRIRDKENIYSSNKETPRQSPNLPVMSPSCGTIHVKLPPKYNMKGKYVFLEIRDKVTRGKMSRYIEIFGGIPSTSPDSKIKYDFAVSDNPALYKIKREDYKTSSEHVLRFCDRVNICIYSTGYIQSYFKGEYISLKKTKDEESRRVSLCGKEIPKMLTGNYIKIAHYKEDKAPFYRSGDVKDDLFKLYIGDSAGRSAFHGTSKEEIKKKNDRKNGVFVKREKKLKLDGYCEHCNIRAQDRFNHCGTDLHIRALQLKANEFKDLDKLIGFFDESYVDIIKHKNIKKNVIKSFYPICNDVKIEKDIAKAYIKNRYSLDDVPDFVDDVKEAKKKL